MATIVRHIESGKNYVLLGTGFGAFKAARPHWFFGDVAPHEESGEIAMACVCDAKGAIRWCYSDQLQVVSVDNVSPAQLL